MKSPKPDTKQMEIQLKVKMRPRGNGSDRLEHWGVIRDWANLTCSVYAEPKAQFSWFHRGTKLENSDETLISSKSPPDNVSLLQVYSKLGIYTCMATNDLGVYNRTINLKKGKKPPKPILKVESIGRDGVAIRVTNEHDPNRYNDPAAEDEIIPAEDLPVIGYTVKYKILNTEDWITVEPNLTTYGFTLRGLFSNATYLIRAAGRNLAGLGDYSQKLQIITLKEGDFNEPNAAYDNKFGIGTLSILLLQRILTTFIHSTFV